MANNYVVNSGVTSSWLELHNSDTLRMLSGGSIANITVLSGGIADLSGGDGRANTISRSGLINNKGAVVTATYVSAGGSFYLYGGSAINTFLHSGGTMSVLGGSATDVKVGNRAHLEMVDGKVFYASLGGTDKYRANFTVYGGYAGYTELREGGALTLSGGTGNHTSVLSGGSFGAVGGTALNTSVFSGGVMSVAFGSADGGDVFGSMTVLNAGLMKNMTVYPGATVQVAWNGSASGITTYGTINVRSGRAENIKLWFGGTMNVESDGRAVGIPLTEGGGTINVSRYGIIENCVLSNGTLNMRGKMLNCSVCGDRSFTVLEGGTASGTFIAGSGALTVSSGGTVLDTTMFLFMSHTTPRGRLVVLSDGLASGVTAYYGHSVCVSGGTVSVAEIQGNASMSVVSGGTAVSANICGDGFIGSGSLLSSGYIYSNTADCWISGSARDVTVANSGRIVLWGRAENVSVGAAGNMYIYGGGLATDVAVRGFFDSGVTVYSGGSLCRVKVDVGGNVDILSGGFVSGATLSSGAYGIYVYSGGLLSAATCESGAKLIVSGSGSAGGLTVSKGAVLSFCVAKETFISGTSAGSAFEIKNGAVNGFSVDSGCQLVVSSGCLAQAIRENGGYVDVIPGANVSFSPNSFSGVELSYNCNATVHSGTTATDVTIHEDGRLLIGSGGTALGIVEDGGYVEVTAGAVVSFAGNSFADMTLTNGNCTVHSGTTATNIEVAYKKAMYVYSGGIARNLQVNEGTLVVSGGGMICGLTADKNKGNVFADNGIVNFDVSTDTPTETSFVNDLRLILGTADYRITVSASKTKAGDYVLANGAAGFDRTVTVKSDTGSTLGTLKNGGTLKSGDRTYSLNVNADALKLTVEGGASAFAPADLNGDGRADIVMTITQTTHPHVGATGAWLIQSNQTAVWGDLSQRNAGWTIFGKGFTAFGKTTADVYLKSDGNVVGAWTTDTTGKVTGWTTVGEFDSNTQVLGLGDFNGDGQTDLLLRNTNGAVGCHLTDGTGWHYFQSLGSEWKICGVGDLNGDGRDDVVLKHDAGFAGSWLTQADCTMKWADLDTLPSGYSIAGTGDFDGDGTDDVLLKRGNYYGVWLVQNGNAVGWFGIGDLGNVAVEEIADFDADGKDDLRIRTANGDLGAQLVKGEDTLQWKYYGSVGQEWSTGLAAI